MTTPSRDPEFRKDLPRSINKVANSDIYTRNGRVYKDVREVAVPEGYKHILYRLRHTGCQNTESQWTGRSGKLLAAGKITPGQAYDGKVGTRSCTSTKRSTAQRIRFPSPTPMTPTSTSVSPVHRLARIINPKMHSRSNHRRG